MRVFVTQQVREIERLLAAFECIQGGPVLARLVMLQTLVAALVTQGQQKAIVVVMVSAKRSIGLYDEVFPPGEHFRRVSESVLGIGRDVHLDRSPCVGERNALEISSDDRRRVDELFQIDRRKTHGASRSAVKGQRRGK